ncbi:NACHT domain-containing protein [Actinoallomurus sp. CA-150999]|uniref:NACHT domain-containing protein n=1 Tax=Actinoallomurus sp. CA-150999 TaxID=3239887 RepID=UPI003D91017C
METREEYEWYLSIRDFCLNDRIAEDQRQGSNYIGAADLLLHADISEHALRILLQGAPGQGKSTLSQYVCQVHRARILNMSAALSGLPRRHTASTVRLPFKVELRHLAKWMRKQNPWASENEEVEGPWAPSVESFITAHVSRSSGGMEFAQSDLNSIVSATPTLLVLDGLDEVADLKLRGEVVESIKSCIARWEALGADLQLLVTSRPASFSDTPQFQEGFTRASLTDLSPSLIKSYTEAWLRIRHLPEDQASELRAVMDHSLEQSHVADLARNPMQLAILLWLAYVKGWSLPVGRTEMYEAYLTAYLDREAKKNAVVRKHRKLLFELHGFLAWIIHSRGEANDNGGYEAGDMGEGELKNLLRAYLEKEERSPELVDQLFHGVERVFVLVSRIEGRYEFEVQPLREFFAAWYLYKTAPHSSSGSPKSGSRPDRLQALIRNPYWLNVTRFFAGFYDKGELADLTRHLQDLCEEPKYKHLLYPRQLIISLLRDRVPAESRRDVRELSETALDALGSRSIISSSERVFDSPPPLPADSGLETLVARAREGLLRPCSDELAHEYAWVLRRYESEEKRGSWWVENCAEAERRLTAAEWRRRGVITDSIAYAPSEEASELFSNRLNSRLDWIRCIEAGRLDLCLNDADKFAALMRAVGEGIGVFTDRHTNESAVLQRLCVLMSEGRIRGLRTHARDLRVKGHIGRLQSSNPKIAEGLDLIRRLIVELSPSGFVLRGNRRESLESISRIIQGNLGPCWAAWRPALYAATVPDYHAAMERPSLTDRSAPVWVRAAAATMRPKLEYWAEALDTGPEAPDIRAVSAAFIAWSHPDSMVQLLPLMSKWWHRLETWELVALRRFLPRFIEASGKRFVPGSLTAKNLAPIIEKLPASLLAMLMARMPRRHNPTLVDLMGQAIRIPHHDPFVYSEVIAISLKAMTRRKDWSAYIDTLRKANPRAIYVGDSPLADVRGFELAMQDKRMPPELAQQILSDSTAYPWVIVEAASLLQERRVFGRVVPVAAVASRQGWFAER